VKLSLPEDSRNKLKWVLLWTGSLILVIGIFFLGLWAVEKNDFIQRLVPKKNTNKNYEVFGFAPYWTLSKLDSINWNILTTFAYFSIPVTSGGFLDRSSYEWQVFEGEKLATLFEKAQSHKVRRVITLTQMEPLTIEAFLNDPDSWKRLAWESVEVIKSKNLDGVNIDFEYIPSNDYLKQNFSNFMDTYTKILNENLANPYITVSVLASSVRFNKIYDISYLAKVTDGVFMMAYDYYYPGSETIGPSAPLYGYNNGKGPFWYDVSTAVEDFLKVADSSKIIMGVPYYGWNYPTFGPVPKGPRSWGRVFATTNKKVSENKLLLTTPIGGWDSQAQVAWRGYWDASGWHVVYMEDEKSLSVKYDFLLSKNLGGVGIWALGYDFENRLWSILSKKFNEKYLMRKRKLPLLHLIQKGWKVEKRLLLIILMTLAGVVMIYFRQGERPHSQITTSFDKRADFYKAINKINGKADWQPKGYGSGEYLQNIPLISAGAVIDLETGEVIWSMNLKKRIAPASLAKLATVMTAMDIESLDKTLTVSQEASEQIPTKLGLGTGEKLTLEEAAAAAILTSANDAAEAISDSLGKELGSGTATFMELVNAKLKKIGALESHFETATGLDGLDHYSTVYDLAILAHEAKTNYPFIAQTAATNYKKLPADNNHRQIDLPNWNALLGTYLGVNGLKIGYTDNAGHVTMVTASRDGEELLAIVIGAKSLEDREIAAATLLNYGFSKFNIEPFPVNQLDLVSRFEDWRRQLSQGGP
jgi:D-alanyl-D-alanine carboxypeptidase/spore germination protein YaaH